MKNIPLITIILSCVGEIKKTERCLQSICEQTYPSLELIFIGDIEKEQLEEFRKDIPALRNVSMVHCQIEELPQFINGSFVTFLSTQHFFFPSSIEKLYQALYLAETEIVVGTFCEFEAGVFYSYWWEEPLLSQVESRQALMNLDVGDFLINRVFASLEGTLLTRELFVQSATFSTSLSVLAADWLWRFYSKVDKIAFLNQVVYAYRRENVVGELVHYTVILAVEHARLAYLRTVEGYPIEQAYQAYYQRLADMSYALNQAGNRQASLGVTRLLIAAEQGIFPYLDLKNPSFTIISNNCWGGYAYQQLGLEYQTPFVGLFILPEDYYKLTKNLAYYMEQDLVFDDQLAYFDKNGHFYPVGHLADVTLHFLHYPSKEDALEKWHRRKARMDWENLYFKFDNKDGATPELLHKIDQLPYQSKIIFVHTPDLQLTSQICRPGSPQDTEVSTEGRILDYFDLLSWLNQGGDSL